MNESVDKKINTIIREKDCLVSLQGVMDNQFALELLTVIDSLIDKGCKEFIFYFL